MMNELEFKYYSDMEPFFIAMAKEMARHDDKNGESYKLGAYAIDKNTRYSSEPPIWEMVKMRDWLFGLLKEHWKKLRKAKFSNIGEYPDHANFCYMIWWQLTNRPSTYETMWGIHEDSRVWLSLKNQEVRK